MTVVALFVDRREPQGRAKRRVLIPAQCERRNLTSAKLACAHAGREAI
ncbi:MAG: hypothetical protein WBF03_24165 [Xanthobacteraceae bacterium]